jgi:hypothetical protein
MADTALSATEIAAATAQPVLEFTRGWLLSPETAKRGAELGLLPGRGFWVCGRAGVLGDTDADVVTAAVGFMHPDRLRPFWETRPDGLGAHDLAAAYAECCFEWARTALSGVPEADLRRLTVLVRRVVDGALPQTGALFAGWRAMPAPADAAAAAALALHVLRELRGGAHITAIAASGLTPAEAALSAPPPRGGEAWARDLGWPEPYPDPTSLGGRRANAETFTTTLVAPAYEALDEAERAELVGLLATAHAAAAASR